MLPLVIQLRAMQLFSQSSHHLCSRVSFHQDHEFFGEVYKELDSEFDSCVERLIGTEGELSLELNNLMSQVMLKLKAAPSVGVQSNAMFYSFLLNMEQELCKLIEQYIQRGVSSGTEQLIGDICNRSEIRQYKIKQRLKK